MKYSIEYILKYDPFDEEDWDEIESKLYDLYFRDGNMVIDYSGECVGNVCASDYVGGVQFSEDVDKKRVVATYEKFYNGIIQAQDDQVYRLNMRIDDIKVIYNESIDRIFKIRYNEIGVIDFGNRVKVGRVKHIRGNRWIGIIENDHFPVLSDDEYRKLKKNGYLRKGFRYFFSGFNRKVKGILLRNMNESIRGIKGQIKITEKNKKRLVKNKENFNFDILDTVLIEKT